MLVSLRCCGHSTIPESSVAKKPFDLPGRQVKQVAKTYKKGKSVWYSIRGKRSQNSHFWPKSAVHQQPFSMPFPLIANAIWGGVLPFPVGAGYIGPLTVPH